MSQPKKTRADAVYERIRADIFNAELEPGSRLKFPDLCARYDTSVGVAREALTRLASERLVRQESRQGYTVVELSTEELTDLTTARVEVESLTFRQAVLYADVNWEADIIAAHHVMSRVDVQGWEAPSEVLDEWFVAHAHFHETLLAGCPSKRLISIALGLRDESELYRRWGVPLGTARDRDVAGEHKAILDAALARDADLAAHLLRDHIAHTAQALITSATAAEGIPVD